MADSVQEAVRIPSTLVNYIDVTFVNEGLFSSRADFISSAIRYYYENAVYMFGRYADLAKQIKSENPPWIREMKIKSNLSIVKTLFINTARHTHVAYFDGEKVTVMCRLPPSLVRAYTRFINETGFYKSKSDFYYQAIGTYLDTQYFVNMIANAIHKRDAGLIEMMVSDLTFGNTFNVGSMIPLEKGDWKFYSVKDTEKEDWLDE
jgi:Arc/MetJ-type ribon-helix-helix transcriptional regulator